MFDLLATRDANSSVCGTDDLQRFVIMCNATKRQLDFFTTYVEFDHYRDTYIRTKGQNNFDWKAYKQVFMILNIYKYVRLGLYE